MFRIIHTLPLRGIFQLMLIAGSLLFAQAASAAAAGKVDFSSGEVTATAAGGKPRPLQKGAEVFSGDTIKTGNGRVQIRYTDGGLISLQRDTQFRIDDYNFNGKADGSEKGIFSLIKGGLRSITGLIGRVNKKNYRVETPVAYIGVRGTEFFAQLTNVLVLTCGQGICVLTNQNGELILNAGECGKATDALTGPTPCEEELAQRFKEESPGTDFGYSSSEDRFPAGGLKGIDPGINECPFCECVSCVE